MSPRAERPDPRVAQADRAAAGGQVAAALALLEPIIAAGEADIDLWRRIASLRRAAGDADGALAAIDAGLAGAPLDFVALLFRASLLEQRGDGAAGEACGRALAQLPERSAAGFDRARGRARAERVGGAPAAARAHARRGAGRPRPALSADERNKAGRLILEPDAADPRVAQRADPISTIPASASASSTIAARFAWLAAWEAATDTIADEFAAGGRRRIGRAGTPTFAYAAHAPVAQWAKLNHSRDWTAIHLINRGEVVEANARHCPRTMALLAKFPQPQISGCGANAMFSLLAPGTRIPPHGGVANFRLVAHLPLIVPGGCWFRVGGETREWRRGEAFVFDDCIEHEAANESDALRVVMIADCWHPDLGAAERAAIAAIVARAAPVVGAL